MIEPQYKFDNAHASDLQDILELLTRVNLPIEGVEEHLEHYILYKEGHNITGVIGLEVYEGAGLLRSLAITPEFQGKGLGSALTKKILSHAKDIGCKEIYLLTTTAKDFFVRFNFTIITGEQVNPVVKNSVEFQGVCPSTATIMKMSLS